MKTFKIIQIIGFILLILGVIIRVNEDLYGTALAMFGFLVFVVGRVGAWLKSDSA